VAYIVPMGSARAGDCDGDGNVAVNELILGVRISLGRASLNDCRTFDANGDGEVSINELISAVKNSLAGCAT
jgi:Ca2+-binding EF-hand superfamily protein